MNGSITLPIVLRTRLFPNKWIVLCVLSIAALSLLSIGFGPAGWDWRLAIAWLAPEHFTQFDPLQINVVTQIRLPRFMLAVMIGLVLAQTGTATQALCRNPLADPSIIGISSGAAVIAVAFIALGAKFDFQADKYLPYAAFLGALSVTLFVYLIAKQAGQVNVTTLILVGVAVNALAFALIGLLSFYADDSALRLINYWTMGSLGGATWANLNQALPLLLISAIGLWYLKEPMNCLLLGESQAQYLGINTQTLKFQIIILVALGVGASVAMTGLIGFVGLVVPHIARLMVGPHLRVMMPLCMLLGIIVLLLSDWLARTLVMPAELPIGIITALLGAPLFIYLILKSKQGGAIA
ncbi:MULTISPECIES: FecCD family ABC transporter permease [unclassified Pseudoalteromonas]|jgi:iron complex transport system permease protein|uniref:FecCD family ABC transporter permease n=1 Tax=unclassified Pseudoalteromonas TaxID=194690 RepID=UPI001AE03A27|nr:MULTISPECIES: iron ABC transporter permease [unclassified Pseudoalteromonas]MCH2088387.1 iron ABC transporter permease [Pseudoalteromonas sp.]MED5513235.1 iron ABC transporter permease [Pseudomonadota bacterium]